MIMKARIIPVNDKSLQFDFEKPVEEFNEKEIMEWMQFFAGISRKFDDKVAP